MKYRVIQKEDRVFVQRHDIPLLAEVFPPTAITDVYWSDYGWLIRVEEAYPNIWIENRPYGGMFRSLERIFNESVAALS